MAAYEALVSMMNTIQHIKNHALISTYFDEERLESVGQRVEFLLDFIEKYSSHGGNNGLEKQIASAAYDAEGVIESHIEFEQILPNERRRSILLANLRKIIKKMDCIKEETIKVKEERRSEDEQQPACSIPAAATSLRVHQTKMVGFDEEFRQLKDALTREEFSRQIISVVGMGGIGKSTLVRNVYANLPIVNHFDVCAWVSVTHKYSVRGILIDLLLSFEQKATSEIEEELGEMLRKFLFRRRYLIVLDDVWDVKVWHEIQLYFQDSNNGSRIVLTTRELNVAKLSDSYCSIRMNSLEEDESWVLFREKVFGCQDCPPVLEKIGKEISKQCKGFPLSIVVVGGFLRRSNKTVEYWNNVAKNINSVLMSSDEDGDCYKILSLSYSQLDVHLKPCLVCTGIFPEGREIRASRIIKVWVAAGFIKPNGTHTLEEIAERYLNELAERNLIVVSRKRWNGKIGSCLVHDLIRNVCSRKYVEDGFACVGRQLRILLGVDSAETSGLIKLLRSAKLLSGGSLWGFRLFSIFTGLLSRGLQLWAVLEMLRVFKMADDSLTAIFKNLHLRFLVYQPQNLETLKPVVVIPSSVSLIWNLQTLSIDDKEVVAPLEIWNSQQLRHVECYEIYIPDPPPNVRPIVLENLQTLTTPVNLRLSEEVCSRIPNVNKLYLKFDSDALGYDHEWHDHLHNLRSLHKLCSLKLVSCLSLSTGVLFYAFRRTCPGWPTCPFPTSLKKLKLIDCRFIDWNDLTIIGSLPHLEVLKLHDSMKGQNWSPAEGEFDALKVLSIVNCDLRCWNADSSHFPVLEKLILEDLRHLEEIPLDIGEIPTLELIHVGGCSESSVISAEKIKKKQEDQGNDQLQLHIS